MRSISEMSMPMEVRAASIISAAFASSPSTISEVSK